MTCQFGQDCHCTSVWLTVLRKLIPPKGEVSKTKTKSEAGLLNTMGETVLASNT